MDRRGLIAAVAIQTATGVGLAAAPPPRPNAWVSVYAGTGTGAISGLVYDPVSKGFHQWGFRDPPVSRFGGSLGKAGDAVQVFDPVTRRWTGQFELTEQASPGERRLVLADRNGVMVPVLPHPGSPTMVANAVCWAPPIRRFLYALGGTILTYDPERKVLEDLGPPPRSGPPIGELGALAWDGVNHEALYLGGSRWDDSVWPFADHDLRAIWTFKVETRTWTRRAAGSPTFVQTRARVALLRRRLVDCLAATRGFCHGAGDLALGGKSPAEVERLIGGLAGDARIDSIGLTRVADGLMGGGMSTYEAAQIRSAADRLLRAVPGIAEAQKHLHAGDPWAARWAQEDALALVDEALEDLAPAPAPRHLAKLVFDPKHKAIVLFGGDGGDRLLADTWVYDCALRQWQRRRPANHPAPDAVFAADFDDQAGLIVLATANGEVWTYDTGADQWTDRHIAFSAYTTKSAAPAWVAMDYDPENNLHCLVRCQVAPGGRPDRLQTYLLTLDLSKPIRWTAPKTPPPTPPEAAWKHDLVAEARKELPPTQADYEALKAAHARTLAGLAPNQWLDLQTPGGPPGPDPGSWAYDSRRHLLVCFDGAIWLYDPAINRWIVAANPDVPPWFFAAGRGAAWRPTLKSPIGIGRGAADFGLSPRLNRLLWWGREAWDPDRFQWCPELTFTLPRGTLGRMVDVPHDGPRDLLAVSAREPAGAPFGVSELSPATRTWRRLPGFQTPFPAAAGARPVYDSKRDRILYYGANDTQLWAYDLRPNEGWSRVNLRMEGATDGPPPAPWSACYDALEDAMLFISADPARPGLWAYDCAAGTLRQVSPSANGSAAAYDRRHHVLLTLAPAAAGRTTVWAFRYRS